MTESAFNRPVPVQEQQAARKAEPRNMAREAYEIGKEQEAEAAAQAEALENAIHDDEAPTAPQDVIDALIAENNEAGELSRELTEAEATAVLEAAMHERIAEAIDNDLETRARVAAIPESTFATLEPEPAKKPEDLDGF